MAPSSLSFIAVIIPLLCIHVYVRLFRASYGAVAQLGERLTGSQKVVGSNPISSTIQSGKITTTN
jgi:hypothetical protein